MAADSKLLTILELFAHDNSTLSIDDIVQALDCSVPQAYRYVKTLLDFARGFGLKSVAEFVENGEIAKILMELGVDYMQGYYFGKPHNHRSWLNEGEYKRD